MRPLFALAVIVGSCLAAGCSSNEQPYVSNQRMDRGLVIVLPGIEGRSTFNEEICQGLFEGGVDCAIYDYDWTTDWVGPLFSPLYNLRASARNHRKAREIADYVRRYRAARPDCPVLLVGHSGGGAIAVWVAEGLGPEERLDGVILLAASLSPDYALDEALHNSRRGIVSFYSHRDWILFATNVTGTMDGALTSSAGRTGFEVPKEGAVPRAYHKLFQIGWQDSMASTGNTGGHLSSGATEFVSNYVAPFVRGQTWTEEFRNRVANHKPMIDPANFAVESQPDAGPTLTRGNAPPPSETPHKAPPRSKSPPPMD